jgi:predicted type IV restriction endonuclease
MSLKIPFKIFTKEEALAEITKLVKSFEEFHSHYLSVDFNETQTRIEFVNPFWRALNWDIDNEKNQSPYHTEIVHEAKQRQDEAIKFADYLFRREESRDFFYLETKKPSVNIKNDTNSALQLRNYGWQRSMKISILSNFENFAIYNCLQEPHDDDKATVGLIDNQFYTYKDYLTKFDFFWEYFERGKVFSGSLETFVRKNVKKGNFKTVDTAFLEKIEEWRRNLAISLLTRNPNIEEYEINFAVQQTIDRMLFLKIAEDRGIEPKNQLKKCAEKGNLYENIYELFYTADQRYNSGLFDFKKDIITKALKVDNKIIKTIITDLYKKGGFNFSIIPVEILGSAYEQFLGKIITFDENKTAKIDFKPEVRKAGGVYYTPQYIVDYIVEHTIGKKIAELESLDKISEISKLKILDPSCGSGSFLLGAYRFLLNFYQNYYFKLKQEGKKVRELTKDDQLTTAVKKQILLNNIYGVDIDTQAVEVTKLSLLIKCLEGETVATVMEQNKLFKERVLPTLDNNILDGNSLISHDFYENSLFLTPKEKRKINTFDWKQGFPDVIKNGGFDFVIGNPPYVSLDIVQTEQKDYLETKFANFATRQSNLYFFFMAVAHKLLKINGLLSFINERYYFNSKNGLNFRKFMQENYQIKEIVDFKNIQIFDGVNTLTVINTFAKTQEKIDIKITQFDEKVRKMIDNQIIENSSASYYLLPQNAIKSNDWNFSSQNMINFKEKFANFLSLDSFVTMGQGITSGLNEVFIVDENTIKTHKLERKLLQKYVKTRDIQPYEINYRNLYLILTLQETEIDKYPKIKNYLSQFTEKLTQRFECKNGQGTWYSVSVPRNLHLFQTAKEKILTPLYAKGNKFGYDNCDENYNYYALTDTFLLVKKEGISVSLKFILGILNSKFMNFYNSVFGKLKRDGYYEYSRNTLSKLPIPSIDFSNKIQKNIHDKIVQYVDKVLELKAESNTVKIPTEKQHSENLAKHFIAKIDQEIYKLYDLSAEEIEKIEL